MISFINKNLRFSAFHPRAVGTRDLGLASDPLNQFLVRKEQDRSYSDLNFAELKFGRSEKHTKFEKTSSWFGRVLSKCTKHEEDCEKILSASQKV